MIKRILGLDGSAAFDRTRGASDNMARSGTVYLIGKGGKKWGLGV